MLNQCRTDGTTKSVCFCCYLLGLIGALVDVYNCTLNVERNIRNLYIQETIPIQI